MLQMRGYSRGTYSSDDNDNRKGATNRSIDGNKNAMETLANIASVVNKTEAHFDVKDLCIIGSILNPEQIDHNNATKAKQRKRIGRCRLIEINGFKLNPLKANRRWLTVVQSEERCRVRTWRLQLTRSFCNRVGVG
ncbi:unnamed protein product [Sphagnum jensenii]|uniref:Uncharacterized protein n=1 Tax=Sphagnum jensenii TaxID=128206 RepID=A0ABP1BX33_9BRYO